MPHRSKKHSTSINFNMLGYRFGFDRFMTIACIIYALIGIGCYAEDINNDESRTSEKQKPNIIIIIADDMGFNDVSIHGSNQIPTPNIDAIGVMGIQLNKMYVAPMCTPSRAAFMTGKYESNVGLQHFVIRSDQPYGLGLEEKTIAEYMREAGYATHMVGKWHLGLFREAYTPMQRGFDSHFGYLGPYIDYFNHSLTLSTPDYNFPSGYDMRQNRSVHWATEGQYATDLFTDKTVEQINRHDKNKPLFMVVNHLAPHAGNEYDPMQAPADEIRKFNYIKDPVRRTYAAMVSLLDKSVGRIVKALGKNDMLENSILLFMSDNGAPVVGQHSNLGSNYPFKGQKDSPWEGAIRSAAAIWSPLLKYRQRISNQVIHISDWLPTFAKIAGVSLNRRIDGKNVWAALSRDLPSPRKEVLNHYDEIEPYVAFTAGNYKYVSGSSYDGLYDKWLSATSKPDEDNEYFGLHYGESVLASDAGQALSPFSMTRSKQTSSRTITTNEINDLRRKAKISCNDLRPAQNNTIFACDSMAAPCLFDLDNDPCETSNIAALYPNVVRQLANRLEHFKNIAQPARNVPGDIRSNPQDFGGIWSWWYDELHIESSGETMRLDSMLSVSVIVAFAFVKYVI